MDRVRSDSSFPGSRGVPARAYTDDDYIELLNCKPDQVHDYDLACIKPPTLTPQSLLGPIIRGTSLGPLSCLPVELQHLVLGYLDLESIQQLSLTCRLAWEHVSNDLRYKIVFRHPCQIGKVLTRLGLAACLTLQETAAVFRKDHCEYCGEHAPWVFLPTLERACLTCFETEHDLRLLRLPLAHSAFRLRPHDTADQVQVKIIPDGKDKRPKSRTRSMREWRVDRTKQQNLIPFKIARSCRRKVFKRCHSTVGGNAKPSNMLVTEKEPLEWSARRNGSIYRIDNCRGMATLRVPKLDSQGQSDYGHHCYGCFLNDVTYGRAQGRYRAPDKGYLTSHSKEDFAKHIEECMVARRLKEGLRRGTIRPMTRRGQSATHLSTFGTRLREDRCWVRRNLTGEIPGRVPSHDTFTRDFPQVWPRNLYRNWPSDYPLD